MRSLLLCISFISSLSSIAQSKKLFDVIAYYYGGPEQIDQFPATKLTHVIFSFCHLKGNRLTVDNSTDSVTIKKLVDLKQKNPKIKVMLSLGGWGGCAPCSEVFSKEEGR